MPQAIVTRDTETIRVVNSLKETKRLGTFSEALEKLIGRAERLNLHRLSDDAFSAMLERNTPRIGSPSATI